MGLQSTLKKLKYKSWSKTQNRVSGSWKLFWNFYWCVTKNWFWWGLLLQALELSVRYNIFSIFALFDFYLWFKDLNFISENQTLQFTYHELISKNFTLAFCFRWLYSFLIDECVNLQLILNSWTEGKLLWIS